jgi:hypothetical protein
MAFNPSIELTSNELRPWAAAHVKRYAARNAPLIFENLRAMSDHDTSLPKLAMRLRAVTQRQPYVCKQFLEALAEERRVAYVEHWKPTTTPC